MGKAASPRGGAGVRLFLVPGAAVTPAPSPCMGGESQVHWERRCCHSPGRARSRGRRAGRGGKGSVAPAARGPGIPPLGAGRFPAPRLEAPARRVRCSLLPRAQEWREQLGWAMCQGVPTSLRIEPSCQERRALRQRDGPGSTCLSGIAPRCPLRRELLDGPSCPYSRGNKKSFGTNRTLPSLVLAVRGRLLFAKIPAPGTSTGQHPRLALRLSKLNTRAPLPPGSPPTSLFH